MSRIRPVDPSLLTFCADDIGEEQSGPLGLEPFADMMAMVVMRRVGGNVEVATAVLQRICALIRCIANDPAIAQMFAGDDPTVIPRPLAHAAAVAPLRINDDFDPAVIRTTALRMATPRGSA